MNAVVKVVPQPAKSLVVRMAERFGVDPDRMMTTLKATAFKGDVSNEQMMSLLLVADQYNLNPWTKEIFAFPDRNNGIVPVVGVDGWSRIINSSDQFDGMDFNEGELDSKNIPAWIECVIFRKDRSHPIKAKEYFAEVNREIGPWKTHPRRMLRHKAMIQCARLAFGFVGVYDPDEAERIVEATATEGRRIDPRPDTSAVDTTLTARWVSDIADILAQDKEEHEIAAMLREADAELSRLPELYTAVFDRLVKEGVITKAAYRDYLKIKAPGENA